MVPDSANLLNSLIKTVEKILTWTWKPNVISADGHHTVTAGVTTGSTVYIAGAGPSLAAAASAQLARSGCWLLLEQANLSAWLMLEVFSVRRSISPKMSISKSNRFSACQR